MRSSPMLRGALYGIAAAALFGMSAPFAKVLVAHSGPVALASLFYLGAGCVLAAFERVRGPHSEPPVRASDLPILAGVVFLGGVAAPVLLLIGLANTSGVAGALLLNLEAPATMMVALCLFGEHLSGREAVGAAVVVTGAALLAVASPSRTGDAIGVVALAGACVTWAFDNNLTQRLSLRDPVSIVRIKTLGAGLTNLVVAIAFRDAFPPAKPLLAALALGALSYGVSIVLDTYALRLIGAAREAVYFATAPFFGALLAVPVLGEPLHALDVIAGAAMGLGVTLLLRARHSHLHHHDVLIHEHLHPHDDHHRHDHESGVPVPPIHSHEHMHAPLSHAHPHVSDAHHRHRH